MHDLETVSVLLVITLFVTNKLACAPSTANTIPGGLMRDEEHPGRSAGPLGNHRVADEDSATAVAVSPRYDAEWNCSGLEGDVRPASSKNVTVQVSHFLFNTDVLVFGIVYQGKGAFSIIFFLVGFAAEFVFFLFFLRKT